MHLVPRIERFGVSSSIRLKSKISALCMDSIQWELCDTSIFRVWFDMKYICGCDYVISRMHLILIRICVGREIERSTMCTDTKTFSSEKCQVSLRLQLHCGVRGIHQTYTTIAANMCCTPPSTTSLLRNIRLISVCFCVTLSLPPSLSLHRCRRKNWMRQKSTYFEQRFIDQNAPSQTTIFIG